MTCRRWCAVVLAVWCASLAVPPPLRAATDGPCRAVLFEGARFTVCAADLRRDEVELFLEAPDGTPYGSLQRLAQSRADRPLAFAMNGGMYHADLAPVGLYVENGRQRHPASTTDGPGNFHLKPNGIFYVAGRRAGILETGAFLQRRIRPDLATQSGPMLVIDGRLHPQISQDGPSRKIRNGIGVRDPQHVMFAISDEPVSFGAFARLFRDDLGCPNALFLDGSISALYAPGLDRSDVALKPLGPLLGVRPRTGAASTKP